MTESLYLLVKARFALYLPVPLARTRSGSQGVLDINGYVSTGNGTRVPLVT